MRIPRCRMACWGLPGSLVAELRDLGVKKCTPGGALSPWVHSPPFSWLNHSSRLHDACFRELFWWMYAYTNDLVFWILFLYSWSYSHCNHWSCNMVLTFFLMPIKFWNNTWLLPQMFCHVFIYVFNLPTCEQFWKREASI